MTHASLFSGIGGFDLAAQAAGWTNAFNCEITPFCQTVLKHHFPNETQYNDIKATDFTVWRGQIDVLTGGFPCQPFSSAGKRKGTDDPRHLWPEMLRAIREISPRWIVGENVRGIVSWSNGLVFEQVCSDLEAEGYEVTPFLLPACGVDAPHRRDRVWFVAHRTDARAQSLQQRQDGVCEFGVTPNTQYSRGREVDDKVQSQQPDGARIDGVSGKWSAADTDSPRSRERKNKQEPISGGCRATYDCSNGDNGIATDPSRQQSKRVQSEQREASEPQQGKFRGGNSSIDGKDYWQNFPTQSPVCRRDDGFSDQLDFNAVFAGIPKPKRARAFPRWRAEAVKAYGNAIVPQVALQIFRAINEYVHLTKDK